jgi:hypothetical protein
MSTANDARQAVIEQGRRAAGQCTMCGEKLGWFARLRGKDRHPTCTGFTGYVGAGAVGATGEPVVTGWDQAFEAYVQAYAQLLGSPMMPVRRFMAAGLLQERTPEALQTFCTRVQSEVTPGTDPKEIARRFSRFERGEA